MEYLEFEKPIEELILQLDKCSLVGEDAGIDVKLACSQIQDKIIEKKKEIYQNLTPWQIVQLSRHPNRPYTLDYIQGMVDENSFIELHGDRAFADDPAMVGGFATIDEVKVMIIGTQKGRTTKERQHRRFGMPNPDGYRKALRLMKLAEKFNIPIITLVDTPGAYPGLEAEERGQGEAIAKNIYEMALLKVPIITYIIGEGASGGALGVGVGNKVYMLENTWYSVISPESCSSILWRTWEQKERAAEALKLTASDMKKLGLVDAIIQEPLGGAHRDKPAIFQSVKDAIETTYKKLSKLSPERLVEERIDKYCSFGVYK